MEVLLLNNDGLDCTSSSLGIELWEEFHEQKIHQFERSRMCDKNSVITTSWTS